MNRRASFYGVRLAMVALVATVALGAFYVAFASGPSLGSYLDSGCSTSQQLLLPGAAYILFEGTDTAGNLGVVEGGSYTVTVGVSGSSTCYSLSALPAGTYTAFLQSGTSSTVSTITFVVTPFILELNGTNCAGPASGQQPAVYLLAEQTGGTVTLEMGTDYSQTFTVTSTCAVYTAGRPGAYVGSLVSSSLSQSLSVVASTTFTYNPNYFIAFYNDPSCVSSSTSTFGQDTTPYVYFEGTVQEFVGWEGVLTSGSATLIAVTTSGGTDPISTTFTACAPAVTVFTSTSSSPSTSALPVGTYTAGVLVSDTPTGGGSPTVHTAPTSAFLDITATIPLLPYGVLPLAAALLALYFVIGRKARARRGGDDPVTR